MLHALNAVLALALLLGSVVGWFALPDAIPVHFGLDGAADRWAAASPLTWFGMPALGLFLAAAMYALGRWLPFDSKWVNLPDKERYLRLPPEGRRPVDDQLRWLLHALAAEMLAVFCLLQLATWRVATGRPGAELVIGVLLVGLLGGPLLTAVGLVRIQKALDRAWRRERASGGASGGARAAEPDG